VTPVSRRTEHRLAWTGVPFLLLFGVGLMPVAHLVPPPSPHHSASAIAHLYRAHTTAIRIGLLLVFIGSIFLPMYAGAIVACTRRIEGASPALRYVQVASIGAALIVIDFAVIVWWVAAFRPFARSPESLLLLNDLGWMIFVIGFPPYVAWAISVGWAILSDRTGSPVYPRWSGYLSVLVGFIQVPPVLLAFFKTGPFAWNGLLSWWVPAIDFFGWFVLMLVLTVNATRGGTPA
jgi:hypothetical protein